MIKRYYIHYIQSDLSPIIISIAMQSEVRSFTHLQDQLSQPVQQIHVDHQLIRWSSDIDRDIQELVQAVNRMVDGDRDPVVQMSERLQMLERSEPGSQVIEMCNVCVSPSWDNVVFCPGGHKFCRSCLNQALTNSLTTYRLMRCLHEECLYELDELSPFYETISNQSKSIIKKIQTHHQVLQNPHIRLCRKETCDGLIDITAQDILCSRCLVKYCHKCYDQEHTGVCDQQISKMLERRQKFRKCSNCQRLVQRNQGCNHITCPCGYNFCYLCGCRFQSPQCCKVPGGLSWLGKCRWKIQHQQMSFETDSLSFSKVLSYLQPRMNMSLQVKLMYIMFFALTLYPICIALVSSVYLLVSTLYIFLMSTILTLYYAIVPLTEVVHLNMKLSRRLKQCLPHLMVRMIVLLLYPIYFVMGLIEKSDLFRCDSELVLAIDLASVLLYCFMIPCLMLEDALSETNK